MKAQRGVKDEISFFNLGASWSGWSTPHPSRSTPGERGLGDQVSIVHEAGCVPGSVWTTAENLTQPRFDPRTFQPVASHNTHYAIPARHMFIYIYTHTHTYIYIYIYIYTHTHTYIYIYLFIYSFKDDTALCWPEILKLIVNSLARFIQKKTGNQFLTKFYILLTVHLVMILGK
jgi:hypothetical protein